MERWKAVVGFEGYYEVSDEGGVRTVERKQTSYGGRSWIKPVEVRKSTFDGRYMVISLAKDGARKRFYLHELVLTAFVGKRPTPKSQGCHNDGDGKNNTLANLRWDTPSANSMDKHRHGRMPVGENHHKSKYSEVQVRQVIDLLNDGMAISAIADRTGVPATTISQVKHGRQWRHLRRWDGNAEKLQGISHP